jgi:hypothetical protein
MTRSVHTVFFGLVFLLAACSSEMQARDATQESVYSKSNVYPPILASVVSVPMVRSLTSDTEEVVLFEAENWQLTRQFPSGYIDVYQQLSGASWHRLPLALGWRRSQIPLKVFAAEDGAELYIFSYDAVANTPSGRSLTISREGIDLYRISVSTTGEPERIASGLPLGAIDGRLFTKVSPDYVGACGGSRCVSISKQGQVKNWNLEGLADHEIIELVFLNEKKAFALTRLKHDDRLHGALRKPYSDFFIATLSPEAARTSVIEEDGIPWGLTIERDQPVLRFATTGEDLRALFVYELGLMPFNGVMEFGSTNLEGRIAWSSVYYLQAFLSLVSGEVPLLTSYDTDRVRSRFADELAFVTRLTLTKYPNLYSKRYSVDREPIMVALHVARVLQLIARAERLGFVSEHAALSRNRLCEALRNLDSTLEESRPLATGGRWLFLKRGFPFWADGANVPYNYVTGMLAGMLEAGCISVSDSLDYLLPLLNQEFGGKDLPVRWRYWWGLGDEGWVEGDMVSVNTPAYAGNKKALAHISYRTMDVAAVLMSTQRGGAIPSRLSAHFRGLAMNGELFPFINEILGRDGDKVSLPPMTTRRFSRAIAPWEIQNQVWALESILSQIR